MKEIRIFYAMHPKRGKCIPEGSYDYTKSEKGIPAMRAIWKGSFFSSEERLFTFAEHVFKIAPVDDKTAHGAAKWSGGGYRGLRPSHIPGIIGLVALGAEVVRGAATATTGTKGFIFYYIKYQLKNS